MVPVILLCLVVGLIGFFVSLKKQKPTFLFLSFVLCLFSSFLFSFYAQARLHNWIDTGNNISRSKFDTFDKFLANYDPNTIETKNKLDDLQNQIIRTQKENREQIQQLNSMQPDFCKQLPTPAYMEGQYDYPIDPKYGSTDYLYQLFTAIPCGSERIQHIAGVADDNYTLGANITLTNAPSTQLLKTLESLNFLCQTAGVTSKQCTYWKLDQSVPVKDIVKLEPFYKEFDHLICVNCA